LADRPIFEYDPANNVWTPKAAMKIGRDRLGAFGWNGHIFAVGGRDNLVNSPVIEEYLPEFDG
jgi:hypothetical protein